MAQGFADLSEKNSEALLGAFNSFVRAAFPFLEKEQKKTDQKMVDMMKKEAGKGVIKISLPNSSDVLRQRAKEMSLPDDFKKRLAERREKRLVEL